MEAQKTTETSEQLQASSKKPYEAPQLVEHGTVEQLTQVSAGGSGVAK